MDKCTCICCGSILDAEFSDSSNPVIISPVYNGLIFRATGNFGSTIFDPMPIQKKEILQIIICDECIKSKLNKVTHIKNIRETVTANAGPFDLMEKEDA